MATVFVFAVLGGLFVVGLFGMGTWLRNAAEGSGNYWLRWWVVIAVIFGGGALQDVVASDISVVLYAVSWLVFVVIGFRRLWEKHVSSWAKVRQVGLGVVCLPVIAVGAWLGDPWTGWSVTGDGLIEYWRGRAGEAAIVLGILALFWVFKAVGQAVGRSSGETE